MKNNKPNNQPVADALRKQTFILTLSDALRPLANPAEILQTAMKMIVDHFEVTRAAYFEVDTDENGFTQTAGYETEPLPLPAKMYFTDYGQHILEAYRSGQPIWFTDTQTDERLKATREAHHALNIRAWIGIPLVKNGRLRAVLGIQSSVPRNWTTPEIQALEEAAERLWPDVERAKAEAALHQSEERYRTLFTSIDEGFCIFDMIFDDAGAPVDYRFIDYNPAFERHTGLHNAIGRTILEVLPDQDQHWFDTYGRVAVTGEPVRVIRYGEALKRWIEVYAFRIGEPKQRRVAALFSDITARKEAELSLRESEEKYRIKLEAEVRERNAEINKNRDLLQATLDSNPEMIQVFKAFRNKRGEIIDFVWILNNHAAEQIYGDVIGKRLLENNPGVAIEGIFNNFVEVTETGIPKKYEKHYTHEQFDGWFYQSVVKLGDGVATTTVNISERKRAEEKLRKLEAEQQQEIFRVSLNTVEEERRRISESIHNGLGQVLYGVKISLSALNKDMPWAEFDDTKSYTINLLSDAIQESRRISHELMPATLEEFGLKTAIADMCRQMQDGIHFRCKVTGLKGRLEKYLELAIYRTMQELLINVVKHAQATEADAELRVSPTHILIKVSDNGLGIDDTRKHKPGIGLASIRSKIKLLNGRVDITTHPNKGTLVEVIIPLPSNK